MRRNPICPRCKARPKKPGGGYCRECYNEYNRERYAAQVLEETGRTVVPLDTRIEQSELHEEVSMAQLIREGKELSQGLYEPDPNWTSRQRAAYDAYMQNEEVRLNRMMRDG